ncbi:hypothetical protein Sru01_41080 [Sphaerisporangium rufum]|uniref:HTH gntR-type domain-containing protein n=1 Tax=Sphaerisporangium rufum TaxID=1381558 RepID=A0A919R659_9ACTN|nr:GntR family transcriptional regulator [Sphaerisporangium rufum]GII79126.1 hypothetical protein Sru01_41080 [Sphaerisporangium rufum]
MAKKPDGRPRHQQIAAEIRALIMSGDLPPGTRLPTTQQLMARYSVTSQTVQRTLNVLKDEGFIAGRATGAVEKIGRRVANGSTRLARCLMGSCPGRCWTGW